MKTILHVIDTTGPGGAETVFIDLATRLPRAKYRPVVVIRGKGWVYEELCRRNIEPILLEGKGSFNLSYLNSLRRLVKQERVDLIQSHLLGANVYCSMTGWLTGLPVVATFHGAVDIGVHERFKRLKFAMINRGASCVVAVSRGLQDDIAGRTTLDERKSRIIYNGIQTAEFVQPRTERLRKKFGWSAQDFVIGSLGNIRPAKGYPFLLEAAALLHQRGRPCRFVIAGQADKDGELYASLLQKRQKLGLEKTVEFLGFLDEPAEFLANLDLFLSSSISEGLPLSAIQAMAADLPLLATRCGGYEELVTDGVNGHLVETENPQALADAVESLMDRPEQRIELAENARKHVTQTFDLSVMLEAYAETYDRLLGD